MIRLLFASTNANKTSEVRQILHGVAEVFDLTALPGLPPVEETGSTFSGNAALKALAAAPHFDGMVIADDSGLEVDVLDGEPGVYSARYAGEGGDVANRKKLLTGLRATGARGKARSARFHCALALAQGGRVVEVFHGCVEGVIGTRELGRGGFGYDPLFIPQGHCRTFAQMTPEEKNRLSHRARALEKLAVFLRANA